jgi:DNA polymerase-1
VPVKEATRYSAEDADVTLRLHALLKPRLVADGKVTVYETLERPLVPVLVEMERAGIMIDPDHLRRLSNDFAKEMAKLEKDIHKLAGGEFNIGSPKQLGDFFFGSLKLPGGRKTKTGAWSTDADVLEELAAQGHDIAKKVLDWRQLSKLRGTYTEALPTYINPKTGRVHTSYAMASPAPAGWPRPIPICRTSRSAARKAGASAGLHRARGIKAHQRRLQPDRAAAARPHRRYPALKKAFADGLDIHAMTASEIFGVPVKGMPAEVRRRAKAINFGIVYGISAFGLANQLGIRAARPTITSRNISSASRHPRLYGSTKAFAREHGYVETLFGRRIHIREINSTNPGHRGGAERAAINAPIQGSAADIIRRAMIRMPERAGDKKAESEDAAAGA